MNDKLFMSKINVIATKLNVSKRSNLSHYDTNFVHTELQMYNKVNHPIVDTL